MGLIVLLAAVITAITAIGLAPRISTTIKDAVCRIAGGDCASGPTAASHLPVTQCETYYDYAGVSANGVAFSGTLGAGGSYTLSRQIDPNGKQHWYVTLQGDGRAGIDAMVGDSANLGSFGESLYGEVKVLGRGAIGSTYEFGDEKAARGFITDTEHEVVKQALVPGPVDPFGWGHKLMNKVDGRSFDPPPAASYYQEAGGQLDIGAGTFAGPNYAQLTLSGAAVIGVRTTPQPTGKPYRTVYLRMSSSAVAALGLFDTFGADGTASGTVVLGLQYDGNGKPIVATLDATGVLKGELGVQPIGKPRTIASIAGRTAKGSPMLNGVKGGAKTSKAQFRIDLAQGDNVDVFADGLHSLGIPILSGNGSADPPNPVDGMMGVYHLFDQGAAGTQLTVTNYSGKIGDAFAWLKGGDGFTFGGDVDYNTENRNITSGSYYSPGNGFVTWEQCGK